MGAIKEKLTKPLPFGVTWVRLGYSLLGAGLALAIRGGPTERIVTKWETKTEIVYKELDNSKLEEKDSWVYKPDGTKEYTRYRLKLAKISNQGTNNQSVDITKEETKTLPPSYSVSTGMVFFGEPGYYADFGMRLGGTPFWAVAGAMVPQNTFKLGNTVFTLGVRMEF